MLRRGAVGRRGPGLIGAAARTAVVAGTATAVSGRVRANQAAQQQQQAQDSAYAAQQQAETQQVAPAPSGGMSDDAIAKLERLATLRGQGVLTDEEFAEQKAKLLGA